MTKVLRKLKMIESYYNKIEENLAFSAIKKKVVPTRFSII